MRRTIVCLCLLVGLTAHAAETGETPGIERISLEWIHKKDELGIDDPSRALPSALTWSPRGHLLAYLQESDRHGKILVVIDATRPDERTVVTADQIRGLPDDLAERPDGFVPATRPTFHESMQPAEESEAATETPTEADDGTSDTGEVDDETGAKEEEDDEPQGFRRFAWLEDDNRIRLAVDDMRVRFDPVAYRFTVEREPELPDGNNEDVRRSPDDRYAAYTRDHDLYAFDFDNGKEIRLTTSGSEDVLNGKLPWVYWEELMFRRSYRAFHWAPRGDAIAFLEFDRSGVATYPLTDFSAAVPQTVMQRYPKVGTSNPTVRLGIVSLSSRQTRWVDLGEPHEYIIHAGWTPDGSALSVQTLNRRQNRLGLYSIDPVTARGEPILVETSDTWVDAFEPPRFLEHGDGFVWLSERTGYRHLYRYSGNRDEPQALTSGDWVVDSPGFGGRSIFVDDEAGRVYFRGTRESPLERHVYWAPLDGGNIRRLTKQPGSHSLYFSSDGTHWIDRWSSVDIPRRIDLLDRDGKRVARLGEITAEDHAPIRFPRTEFVTFSDADGTRFHASLIRPTGFDPQRRYPVVAYVYGEPAGQVVLNRWISSFDALLADRGFVVFRFDGRGTPGRGRPWLDPIYRDQMTVPMQDWRTAVAYLRDLPYVDDDRLGIWGWSGGGTMTLNLMLRTPGLFQAGAAVAAVTDKTLYDTIYTERYLGLLSDNRQGYEDSSPLHASADLEGRLLIAHGISDDNVHVQNAYNLIEALYEAEKPYELYLYPQKKHGIRGGEAQFHLFERILEFFEDHLGSESGGPSRTAP